ncbi:MAG: hypothetical protein ABII81_10400 [Pseudomonadota bacterium]
MQVCRNVNAVMQRSNEMSGIVAINEDIKQVMRIAGQINLAAINAMLIANKIGRGRSGFSVVSAELRAFSRRLSEAMTLLMAQISDLVREMAVMIRMRKMMRLRLEARQSAAHYVHWDEVLRDKSAELQHTCTAIVDFRSSLLQSVGRANKLCAMGLSLSYSAKVEAVYGGDQIAALRQVSQDAESAIDTILSTLKHIAKQLEAAR